MSLEGADFEKGTLICDRGSRRFLSFLLEFNSQKDKSNLFYSK